MDKEEIEMECLSYLNYIPSLSFISRLLAPDSQARSRKKKGMGEYRISLSRFYLWCEAG